MPQISIQITNLPQIKSAFRQAPRLMVKNLNEAIKRSTLHVSTVSTRNAPIVTGYLRRSHFFPGAITLSNLRGEFGPKATYAIYVHEGTRYMRARPFLFNAVKTERGEVEKFFAQAVQKTLDEIARQT